MATVASALTDKDFLEMPHEDQKGYLASIDPEFSKMSPQDQEGYHAAVVLPAVKQHAVKINTPPAVAKPAGDGRTLSAVKSGALGLASGLTGAPETQNSLYDMTVGAGEDVAAHPVSSAVKASLGPIPAIGGMVKNLYGAGKEMLHGAGYSKPRDLVLGPRGEVNADELAHGAGSAIGQIGQVALGKGEGEQATGERPSVIRRISDPAVAPGLSEEATKNLSGKGPSAADVRTGNERIFKAASPTTANTNFRENLATALPDLKAIEQANPLGKSGSKGGIVNPDLRVRQTVTNIRGFLDNLWNNERQPQIDRHADLPTMGRRELGLNDDELKTVESRMGKKIPEHMTLKDADGLLKDVNAFLQKTNSLSPEARAQVTATSPILDHFDQMHDRLHQRIGERLEGAGEPGVMDFNKRYAALSAVRNALERRMNSTEGARLLDNVQVRAGLNGPGILERLHIKASPGRELQKGLEHVAASDLPVRPAPGVPERFRGATGPNLPGHFEMGAQTPFGQQQPVGDLWAGPPAHWIPNVGEGGGWPEPVGPARPTPGVNFHADPRVAENMRAAARPPGGAPPNAAGVRETTAIPPIAETSNTILPGRTGTATAGLLPERIPPEAPTPPPPVEPQFAKEATGTVQDRRMVGERGEQGTRGPVLIRRTAPIPTQPRGVYRGALEGPIGNVSRGTPPTPQEIFGGNPQAEMAAVEPEIMARQSRQQDIRQRAMRDAANAFESQQGPVIDMVRPENATPPGGLANRFDNPQAAAPAPIPTVAEAAPPRLKGGINAQGFEASTRQSSPRDIVDSLEAENSDLRKRAEGADDQGKATVNERIRQNEERIAELKGKKPAAAETSFRAGTAGPEAVPGYKIEESMGKKSAVDPNGVRIYLKGDESTAQIQQLMNDQVARRAQMQKDLFGPK